MTHRTCGSHVVIPSESAHKLLMVAIESVGCSTRHFTGCSALIWYHRLEHQEVLAMTIERVREQGVKDGNAVEVR
jgi:hypothetical protein